MEIEIRAFVKNFEALKNRLNRLSCKKVSDATITDIWFCKKEANAFKDIKMDSAGSIGLRIRKESGKMPEINLKTIATINDHNVFEELETHFIDVSAMEKILDQLGFKPFCKIKKKREIFQLDEMKINLEDIQGFPPCIEVEIIANKDFNLKLNKINDLLKKIGVSEKNKIEKSITALYMEKHSFKQKEYDWK